MAKKELVDFDVVCNEEYLAKDGSHKCLLKMDDKDAERVLWEFVELKFDTEPWIRDDGIWRGSIVVRAEDKEVLARELRYLGEACDYYHIELKLRRNDN